MAAGASSWIIVDEAPSIGLASWMDSGIISCLLGWWLEKSGFKAEASSIGTACKSCVKPDCCFLLQSTVICSDEEGWSWSVDRANVSSWVSISENSSVDSSSVVAGPSLSEWLERKTFVKLDVGIVLHSFAVFLTEEGCWSGSVDIAGISSSRGTFRRLFQRCSWPSRAGNQPSPR